MNVDETCRDFCNKTVFRCKTGGCVSDSLRCNEIEDCDDGSDEEGCYYFKEQPGEADHPTFFSQVYFCGAIDSESKQGMPIDAEESIINHWQVCNHIIDCPDGKDEAGCEYPYDVSCLPMTASTSLPCRGNDQYQHAPCLPGFALSKSGDCVVKEERCSTHSKSTEESVLNGCIGYQSHSDVDDVIMAQLFQCSDHHYIPVSNMCDNRVDCSNMNDERGCRVYSYASRLSGNCTDAISTMASPSATCGGVWCQQTIVTAAVAVGVFVSTAVATRVFHLDTRFPTAYHRFTQLFGFTAAVLALYDGNGEANPLTFCASFWVLSSGMGLFSTTWKPAVSTGRYSRSDIKMDDIDQSSIMQKKLEEGEAYEEASMTSINIGLDPLTE